MNLIAIFSHFYSLNLNWKAEYAKKRRYFCLDRAHNILSRLGNCAAPMLVTGWFSKNLFYKTVRILFTKKFKNYGEIENAVD